MATPSKTPGSKVARKNERRYPRTHLRIKATIIVLPQKGRKERALEATLETRDVSMTGVFFESTFFLRIGTKVQVHFNVEGDQRTIIADGLIMREERGEVGSRATRSGFAIHFTDFIEDSAVVLASMFLAPRVKVFVERYMQVRRAKELKTETDRLIDVLVGWELAKAETEDIWASL
jgi:PilZ domain